MFCKNCGSNVEDNEIFCSVCGSKLTDDVQDNAQTQTNEQTYNQTDNTTNYTDYSQAQEQPYSADYSQAQQSYSADYTQQNSVPPVSPKKKGGIGKIIAIAGGAVAVVAVATVGTLAATGRLGNFLHKTFSSPESYFKYVAEKSTDDVIESFNSNYSAVLDSIGGDSSSLSGKCAIKLEAGEGLKPFMGMVDSSLENLDNAEVSINASLDESIQNMEIKANINDSEIATIKTSIDIENEKGYIQIPELSDSYIDISDGIEEMSGELTDVSSEYQDTLNQVKDILPDAKTTSNIMNTYIGIALDNVSDVKKSSEKVEAEGVSQKLTTLSTTLDGKYCYNTACDILDAVKDDKDIKNIIESVDEDSYEEFQESIEEAIDQLKDSEDNFDDIEGEAELTLYVDGKGEIVGTKITAQEDDNELIVSSVMPKKNSKFGYEMKVEVNDEEILSMTGSGTLKKDIMNGDFSISLGDMVVEEIDDVVSDGKDVLKLNIKDFNVKECKEGKLNGSFTFSSDSISQIKNYELTVDFASNDKETAIGLSVASEGTNWAKVSITLGEGEELEAIEPSSSDTVYSISDEYDLEEYIDSVDIDSFVNDIIDASGIDIEADDIIDMIEDNLGSSYSSYEDDDDYYSYEDDDDYSYDDSSYDDSSYDWNW